MVLQELGQNLQASFRKLSNHSNVDSKLIKELLKDITSSLLESDIHISLVSKLRDECLKELSEIQKNGNSVVKRDFQRVIFNALTRLIDPGVQAPNVKKGQQHVIMFVGLQGSGKTTSCTKLAYYYSRKGFKTGLVCTDTFRAGAFDQLKQNATKAKIPFYGSYSENDPVALAQEGVAKFKKEGFEIIIVDTSGRHRQEADLFSEMAQISDAIDPFNIIFVLDGAIGQAAESHARAFKESVPVGSIIITKMDGHAKGGGAISAVAATGSPIIFIGTGEHIHDLEPFVPTSFINKMLGMGDLSGLLEKFQDLKIDREGLIRNISKGVFTFRDMKGQFEMISGMGPMSKIMGMIPGMQGLSSDMMDNQGSKKLKNYTCLMDSMTETELESSAALFRSEPTRIYRVAKGAGVTVREVEELLSQHDAMSGMVKSMGGPNGMLSNLAKGGPGGGGPDMSRLMGQLGQGGMPDLSRLMGQMGQQGGISGMMQQMFGGMNPPM